MVSRLLFWVILLLDNPVIGFLCEQRASGNVGFLSSEFIRVSLGRSRCGSWNDLLNDLERQGYVLRAVDTGSFRHFLYCISDEVFDEWLTSTTKPL